MPSPINLRNEGNYHHVNLGVIPDVPAWHEQSSPSSFAFPTIEAARRFAASAEERHPGREVWIS